MNYGQRFVFLIREQELRPSPRKRNAKTRPGADYASDLKLLIAKFRLKLQKVGKTTRLLRYNLDQIPYYTVEVTNRFKGLDSVNKVTEELLTEVRYIV